MNGREQARAAAVQGNYGYRAAGAVEGARRASDIYEPALRELVAAVEGNSPEHIADALSDARALLGDS